MKIPRDIGLQNLHGLRTAPLSDFVRQLLSNAVGADYVLARGFATREPFDPTVVCVGVQFSRNASYIQRVGALLDELVRPDDLVLLETIEPGPFVRPYQVNPNHPAQQFIGRCSVAGFGNPAVTDELTRMAACGIDPGSLFIEEQVRSCLARIEHGYPGRTFVIAWVGLFLRKEFYFGLEDKILPFCLLGPAKITVPDGLPSKAQDHYRIWMKLAATAKSRPELPPEPKSQGASNDGDSDVIIDLTDDLADLIDPDA